MDEKITERCRRICGEPADGCFISNGKQVECIADIIINKASVSLLGLEQVIRERSLNKDSDKSLSLSVKAINELVNWVKFLQISHDLRKLLELSSGEGSDKREEARYPLPEIYQEYVRTHVNVSDSYLQVALLNFSQSGLQFKSPKQLKENETFDCMISTSHAIKKKVHFKIICKYCSRAINKEFLIGAQIIEVSDNMSFNFFINVYDFIKQEG